MQWELVRFCRVICNRQVILCNFRFLKSQNNPPESCIWIRYLMVKIILILTDHYTFLYCQQVWTLRNMFFPSNVYSMLFSGRAEIKRTSIFLMPNYRHIFLSRFYVFT